MCRRKKQSGHLPLLRSNKYMSVAPLLFALNFVYFLSSPRGRGIGDGCFALRTDKCCPSQRASDYQLQLVQDVTHLLSRS